MIWLQTPPWGRWIAAGLIVLGALWVEFRPDPSVEHPFATEQIVAGAEIGDWNTRPQRIPAGLLEPVIPQGVALTEIAAGEPILVSAVGEHDEKVPEGWWAIEIALPAGAATGDKAEVVLLDSGSTVPAVVVNGATDDPLGSGRGTVAVSGDRAAEVAAGVVNGRVAVMIATG